MTKEIERLKEDLTTRLTAHRDHGTDMELFRNNLIADECARWLLRVSEILEAQDHEELLGKSVVISDDGSTYTRTVVTRGPIRYTNQEEIA